MAESSGEAQRDLNKQPQFEIPQTPEDGQERISERAIEKRGQTEAAPTKKSPQFPASAPSSPPPIPSTQQQGGSGNTSKSHTDHLSSLPADDVDLIEKQWVERAKSIVAQTRDDPYKQKNELSKEKVDYIKKRFNKTIPLDDAIKS